MRGARKQVSVYIDGAVADRARDVAYGVPGLTLSKLVEAALVNECYRREAERGERFPGRPSERLRPGRPPLEPVTT